MIIRLVSLTACVLLLSGCLAYSRHPLSAPGEAVTDPALIGDWHALLEEEEGRLDVHVATRDGQRLEVTTVEEGSDGSAISRTSPSLKKADTSTCSRPTLRTADTGS